MKTLFLTAAVTLAILPGEAFPRDRYDLSEVDAIDLVVVRSDQESRVPIRPTDLFATGRHHVIYRDRQLFSWMEKRLGERIAGPASGPGSEGELNAHLAIIAFENGKPVFSLYANGTSGNPQGIINGRRVTIDYRFVDEVYAKAEKAYGASTY